MLPVQSDHQSECLLDGLFLGCISRGLFWASRMRTSSISILVRMGRILCSVYRCMVLYTFRPEADNQGSCSNRARDQARNR
jgi:hypothetical protein